MNGNEELYLDILVRLGTALLCGGLIGMERSYRGRPAGFRTHALVCLASAALMLVTVYEALWFPGQGNARVIVDPTRMAQGIMTGIGFLGAGVIMKDGLSVRGLTTAASIWITAAIGVLVGVGFYTPAALATVMTLGTLSVFRWIERRMQTESFAEFVVRFSAQHAMLEPDLRRYVSKFGFSVARVTHRYRRGEDQVEYRMTVRTLDPDSIRRLAEELKTREDVEEFRISPTGD